MDALLASEDYGKDLASVNNLLKKHQLLEADISAHEVSGMPDLPASHYYLLLWRQPSLYRTMMDILETFRHKCI